MTKPTSANAGGGSTGCVPGSHGEPGGCPAISREQRLTLHGAAGASGRRAEQSPASGSGWCWPGRSDDSLESANRKSLRGAIEALQVLSPDVSRLDPALIRALERASGLKDLRFDHDPPGGGRQVQSLLDGNGRIVGWFSWEAQRPATALLYRLLPLGALIAAGLFGFAGLALVAAQSAGTTAGARASRRRTSLRMRTPRPGCGTSADF